MTVPIGSELYFTGNGTVDTFSYTFKVFQAADLEVAVREVATGAETELEMDTDYEVDPDTVGDDNGGSITLLDDGQDWVDAEGDLDSGWVLVIRRKLEITQETDIRNEGQGYKATLEDQFDRCVMIDQQQQNELDRSLKLPVTEDPDDFDMVLPDADSRASKVLGFDADGNLTAVANVPTSAVTASAFMETVLDDASSHEALTTLAAGLDDMTEETSVANNDNLLLHDESEGAANRITVANLKKRNVEAKTASYPIVAGDNAKVFTNEGAAGSVTFTLPAAAAGYELTFVVQAAQSFVVTANTGDTIRIGGSVSTSAGTATSSSIGSVLKIVSINATEWVAVSYTGSWALA